MINLNCYLEVKNSDGKWHTFGESTPHINQNFTVIPLYKPIKVEIDEDMLYTVKGFPCDLSYELKSTFEILKEEIRKNNSGKFSVKKSLISYVPYEELSTEFKKLIDNKALDAWRALPNDIKRVLFISLDNARNWSNRLL